MVKVKDLPLGGELVLNQLPTKSLIFELLPLPDEVGFQIRYYPETQTLEYLLKKGESESTPRSEKGGYPVFLAHTHPFRRLTESGEAIPEENLELVRRIDALPSSHDLVAGTEFSRAAFCLWTETGVTFYLPLPFVSAAEYQLAAVEAIREDMECAFDPLKRDSLGAALEKREGFTSARSTYQLFLPWDELPEDFLDPKYLDGLYRNEVERAVIEVMNGQAYVRSGSGGLIEYPNVHRLVLESEDRDKFRAAVTKKASRR